MVAQKFKILSKRTVRGSALTTLSDTKQGFTVPKGNKGVRRMGFATFVNFCTCFLYLSLLIIYLFQLDIIFSIAFILTS